MENEGIMALPMGEGMPEQPAPTVVSSADAYDAAKTALGMTNPQALEEMKASLRENLADVDLTPREIDQLLSVFEHLTNNPQDYQQILQQLLARDMIDPGDMPEEYDPVFVGAALAVLNELKMSQAEGAMQPMTEGPPIAAPMAMAQGGLADMAGYLASQGRNGDTMLAHITPDEAAMLQAQGGSGTINPNTGLPEYFKKFFKKLGKAVKKVLSSPIGRIIGTIALATILGPTAIAATLGTAGTAALAAGTVTLAGGGNIKEALVSAALGYVGGGGTIGGVSPLQSVGSMLPGAGSALNTGLTTGVLGTGAGLALGMKPKEALKMGATAGLVSGGLQALSGPTAQAAQQGGAQPSAEITGPPAPASLQAGAAQQPMMQSFAGEMGTGAYSPTGELMASPSAPSFAGEMGTTASTPYSASGQLLPPGANPAQPGMLDRLTTGAKDLYNQYLSPSRPGLAADAGMLQKYGPLAAAGTAVAAASGAFKTPPTEEEPLYSNKAWMQRAEQERLSREQQLANVDYGLTRGIPMTPPSPGIRPPSPYIPPPPGGIPVINPTGVTQTVGGIPQPYNVPGMYNIPLLYGPQPVQRAARGGEMRPTEFPRKTGPINGPGTGTSDSIPAMLSDGEFVFTAKAVRNAGGGSRRKGAARMYKMMKMLEGGPVKGK
jgi:hypothetical protein